jgi:hypothetical protein
VDALAYPFRLVRDWYSIWVLFCITKGTCIDNPLGQAIMSWL